MLRFLSLSSGSCGNCYYLEHTDSDGAPHALLIDAGVSLRRLKQVLQANSLDENSFSSVLITHDHMDHIRSLASYCKRLKKPVYATSECIRHSQPIPSANPIWVNADVNSSRMRGTTSAGSG